jgi:hypothetical protein
MAGGAEPLVRMRLERVDGRATVPVLVRRLDDDRYEVHGADGQSPPDVPEGARAVLLRGVQGDASYATPVTFGAAGVTGQRVARRVGDRQRVQQRGHVRSRPPPLDVTVLAPAADDEEEPRVLAAVLLDISAGGLRCSHPLPVLPDRLALRVHVSLPNPPRVDIQLDVKAEVRRAGTLDDHAQVAVMFYDLPRMLEQRLVSWIFELERGRRREGRPD